jgi:hypothetical protein
MADFQSQAMGLTGLTIDGSSSAPSRTEFSQFLSDGVIDVTSKHLTIKPSDDHLFLAVSTEQTSQGLDLNGARITSVLRESGTDNDWRKCSKINPSKQGQAVATGSLHLATTHNPVYTILDNGGISVFPAPGSDPNTFKVYYVNNSPVETDGSALDHASIGIKYFPNDKVYLVILYASIKSLESALSAKGIPTISGDGTELTSVDDLDTDNTIDVHADQIEIDQWWSTAGHLIEGAEDLEMASIQLQKINAYVQAYATQLQGNTTDYQWMQSRHQILSRQYDLAFASANQGRRQ